MFTRRIAFVASDAPSAQVALTRLTTRYGQCAPEHAERIVALGGDGFLLETLHRFMDRDLPIYGMNRGSVGFLLNDYVEDKLIEKLERAEPVVLRPLRMTATGMDGNAVSARAINEVSLLRETRQAAKLRIRVDGKVRMDELICDGILVSTPAGSTAYNLSAHGPIMPLGTNALALTPISAFRPRRWRGALLRHTAQVGIEVLEAGKRPVSAVADSFEVRDVREVQIAEDPTTSLTVLFDPEHSLEERILKEQFTP